MIRFRPKRDARHASQEIYRALKAGYSWVVDCDLKQYFDTIPHDRLIKTVARRLNDRMILKLVKGWLKAGVMEEMTKRTQSRGTPQGGVISPLLANIYLHELDSFLEDARQQGTIQYFRYADDFILCARTKEEAEAWLTKIKESLRILGLALNGEKTRIVHVSQGFDFLGYRFQHSRSRVNPKKQALYFFPGSRSVKALKSHLRRLVRRTRPTSAEAMVSLINPILRGWAAYYRHTNAALVFQEVQEMVNDRVRRFLRFQKRKKHCGYKDYPVSFLYQRLGLVKITGTICYALQPCR